jgi:4-hydroxy-2-oxoheptanedioate aldolase
MLLDVRVGNETLKERLYNGETVTGTLQITSSPQVSEAVGLSGMDFVVFDQEHGPLSAESSLSMAMGAQQGGAAPVVRVRSNVPHEIQRGLDIGTAGVQIPQIETRADAEKARDAARFSPLGERGLSQYVRAGGYTGAEDYTAGQNEETTLVLQVEGKRGIDNIEEIVEVDGVDVIFLGPYDISSSLGIPGQIGDERVEELMTRVVEVASDAGTVVGTFADDAVIANRWADAGVQYLLVGVPTTFLTRRLNGIVDQIDR